MQWKRLTWNLKIRWKTSNPACRVNRNNYIKLLIGIDDTDNADSRGAGFLAHQLEASVLGKVNGITRHQLFNSWGINLRILALD
jgi:hypothetical protein